MIAAYQYNTEVNWFSITQTLDNSNPPPPPTTKLQLNFFTLSDFVTNVAPKKMFMKEF